MDINGPVKIKKTGENKGKIRDDMTPEKYAVELFKSSYSKENWDKHNFNIRAMGVDLGITNVCCRRHMLCHVDIE